MNILVTIVLVVVMLTIPFILLWYAIRMLDRADFHWSMEQWKLSLLYTLLAITIMVLAGIFTAGCYVVFQNHADALDCNSSEDVYEDCASGSTVLLDATVYTVENGTTIPEPALVTPKYTG